MTYNTGNPIGSTDARDRSDNSENLDFAVNSLSPTFVDRLGVTRDTLEGVYQKSAYYRAGTFDAGYTLTNNRQTLAYGNVEYSWSGVFPKAVSAGSTPATSGGVGSGAWVDRTDSTLRDELDDIVGTNRVSYLSDLKSATSEYDKVEVSRYENATLFSPPLVMLRNSTKDNLSLAGQDWNDIFDGANPTGSQLVVYDADGRAYEKQGPHFISQLFNSDTGDAYHAIRIANAAVKHLYIDVPCHSSGVMSQALDSIVEFVGGGRYTMTAAAAMAWGFVGGVQTGSKLINAVIDCARIAGLNGLGIGGSGLGTVQNITVTNPTFLNCIREPNYLAAHQGGGRGFNIESNVKNIHVINPRSVNCTSGFSYQGTSAAPADVVIVDNPIAINCMHYAEFFDLLDGGSTTDSINMGGINISGGYAYGVGKAQSAYYSNTGTFNATTDTGAIIGERARHVTWHGFKIHNDSAYGQIGAVWRGTGQHINISGEFLGNCYAIADVTTDNTLLPIGSGTLPAGASIISRGFKCDIKVVGVHQYSYRCYTPSGDSTGHAGHDVSFTFSSNPVSGLISVPAARQDATIKAFNYNTGAKLEGRFSILNNLGNAMPSADKISYNVETFASNVFFSGPFVYMTAIPSSAPTQSGRVFRVTRGDGTSDLRIKE